MENLPDWEQRVVRRAWDHTLRLANDHAVYFATAIGLVTVLLGLAVFQLTPELAVIANLFITLGSTLLLVLVAFAVQIVATQHRMLHEVRREVGRMLEPVPPAAPDLADFGCAVTTGSGGLVGLVVTNRNGSGTFTVQVARIEGVAQELDTPWTAPWRDGDAGGEIVRGGSQAVDVVRVRSARRLEFLRREGGETVTAAACADDAEVECTVRVGVEVHHAVGSEAATRPFTLTLNLRRRGRSSIQSAELD